MAWAVSCQVQKRHTLMNTCLEPSAKERACVLDILHCLCQFLWGQGIGGALTGFLAATMTVTVPIRRAAPAALSQELLTQQPRE